MNKHKDILLAALRQGIGTDSEIRLFRSGKFPGLFPSRTSVHAELAQQAIQEGMIELVRSETKGKTTTEWVKVKPPGIQFVLDNESPLKVLEELHHQLRLNQEGYPAWIAELRLQLESASQRFLQEVETISQRLEQTTARVSEALKRLDQMGPPVPEGAAGALPWAHEAVEYLNQRGQSSLGERCPLPELFNHLRAHEAGLTLHDFHSGLRRLHDRGLIRLLAMETGETPNEPEYLLLDGAAMYYFAAGGVPSRSA